MKKYNTPSLLWLSLFIISFSQIFAQAPINCGTDQVAQDLEKKFPGLLKAREQAIKHAMDDAANKNINGVVTYTIPIVFHVLHLNGTENINDQKIIDQVNRLNLDFQARNTDTASVVPAFKKKIADIQVEFKLAQLDPWGNCTNGIDRIYSNQTNSEVGRISSKINSWDPNTYLNVWTVAQLPGGSVGNTLGYAHFAQDINSSPGLAPYDGILMLASEVNSNSRTLTHEIGHYLNLPHVWGGGEVATACGDDGIYDTPVTKGHFSTCPLNSADCSEGVNKRYTFFNVTPTSGATDTTTILKDSLLNYSKAKAVGVSANTSVNKQFAFTDWDLGGADQDTVYANQTGSINTGKYYEFTITPRSYAYLTLSSINFNFERNATGVRTFAVRSSMDGYTNNLPTTSTTSFIKSKSGNILYSVADTTKSSKPLTVTLSATTFSNITTPVTFRFYGWNAEDVAGSFRIDSVTFNGTIAELQNVQNYMDYSNCVYMFTEGQKQVMHSALNGYSFRKMWKQNRLQAAGVLNPPTICKPKPNFSVSKQLICNGSSVTYVDLTSKGVLSPVTSRVWYFPDGNPSTSTAINPSVTYNVSGWKTAKLVVTNSAGTDSITQTQTVYVGQPNNATDIWGLFDNFELPSQAAKWTVFNPDNDNHKFQYLYTGNGYDYSTTLYLNNIDPNPTDPTFQSISNNTGNIDYFITPSLDLSQYLNGTFSYKWSMGSRASSALDMADELKVYASNPSCTAPAVWNSVPIHTNKNSALINAGTYSSPYFPTSNSLWSTATFSLSPSLLKKDIRFKFEFKASSTANNIFFDDFMISGTVDVFENENVTEFNIYPNPANEYINVEVKLNTPEEVTISLTDIVGREVMRTTRNTGDVNLKISGNEFPKSSGVYFVKVVGKQTYLNKKMVISK